MATWEEIRDEVAGMLADGKPLEDVISKLEKRKNETAKPMTNDITILSCPICNNPKLREYGNGIYQCDVCETYFDKDENVVLTEQEWLQTADTEQLAEFIADKSNEIISWIICEVIKNECDVDEDDYWQKKSDVVEWLKQPHTFE